MKAVRKDGTKRKRPPTRYMKIERDGFVHVRTISGHFMRLPPWAAADVLARKSSKQLSEALRFSAREALQRVATAEVERRDVTVREIPLDYVTVHQDGTVRVKWGDDNASLEVEATVPLALVQECLRPLLLRALEGKIEEEQAPAPAEGVEAPIDGGV